MGQSRCETNIILQSVLKDPEYLYGIVISDVVYDFSLFNIVDLEHIPMTWSMKSLLCSWGLFSVVVTAAYAGNLAALLTAKKERAPFNNFRELVHQNEYKWGIASQPGSIFINLLSVRTTY